jgi:hypothetical protein
MYLRLEKVCAQPYAQYTTNVEKIVFDTENKTESRSSITNKFQNIVEKPNPYQSENRRRRPEPTPASLLCTVYYVSYLSRTVKAEYW